MQTLGTTNLINYVQITQKPTFSERLFDFEMMSDFNAHITSQKHNVAKNINQTHCLDHKGKQKKQKIARFCFRSFHMFKALPLISFPHQRNI